MNLRHLTNKRRSQISEKRLAAVIGGRPTPASGALRMKGDVSGDFFLGEDKFTDAKSYSLKKATWDKIRREAFSVSKHPMMRIDIDGTVLYVMEEETFRLLQNGFQSNATSSSRGATSSGREGGKRCDSGKCRKIVGNHRGVSGVR